LAQLCELIGVDADLLAGWLRLFDCPADAKALFGQMATMGPQEFKALAQAQAELISPIEGVARLSVEQWRSVLNAACLVEILYDTLAGADSPHVSNVRTRSLLALSGVNLDADPLLTDLVEFRGVNPALLEDASLELRVFAVVDGIQTGSEAELANNLLNLGTESFASLVAEANARAVETIERAGIDLDADVDWAHRNWLRQQVSIACACFAEATSPTAFIATHKTVGRMLFATVPELFLVQGNEIKASVYSELKVSQASVTSLIAQCLRVAQLLPLSDSLDLPVIDRQVLRSFDGQEGIAIPIQGHLPLGVLVVKTDEDVDVEYVAGLYSEELAKWLTPAEIGVEGSTVLDQFRAAETQRLREIVHEANNPLSIVYNYLHILELRLQTDPEVAEQLDMIGRELRRAGDVISSAREVPQLIAETLDEVQATDRFNLIETVRRSGELHKGYAGERGIDIEVALDAEEVTVVGDEAKLSQVLSNLVKNAIEACRTGDVVELQVRQNVFRDGRLVVEVVVEDNGPGIQPDVLDVLFEPKVTTKGAEHQGLGLHLTHRLIGELAGSVDVRTGLGQGTAFHIYLPLTQSDHASM
jgi:signal transduction histidine kinase